MITISKELDRKFTIAEKAFKDTKYQSILDECLGHYECSCEVGIEKCLGQLPSSEDLFRDMLEKLSHPKPFGKPIFKTMKKIIEGKEVSREEKLKAYFSFCTHICIELEKGNNEYRMLLDTVYEKIGGLLYG
jgi:hypothetical protein